jgi:hypothetical protein
MRILGTVLLMALILARPNTAVGWHKEGHMTIARLAWLHLNDKQKGQIVKILAEHPHYKCYMLEEMPAELTEQKIDWVFLRAATWPDWVRDPSGPCLENEMAAKIKADFNKPSWHFVNLPFIDPTEAEKFDAPAIRKLILDPEYDEKTGEPRHAIAALKQSKKVLHATDDASNRDKAIKLCWLLHLIGDLHQPLHCCALISSKYPPPHGDHGGNLFAVSLHEGGAAKNLHFYWDGLLFHENSTFKDIDTVVEALRKRPEFQRDKLNELTDSTDFLAWADESLQQAKAKVYAGRELKGVVIQSDKDLTGLKADVVPPGYVQTARATAELQMVLAGSRLADQLKLLFKPNE